MGALSLLQTGAIQHHYVWTQLGIEQLKNQRSYKEYGSPVEGDSMAAKHQKTWAERTGVDGQPFLETALNNAWVTQQGSEQSWNGHKVRWMPLAVVPQLRNNIGSAGGTVLFDHVSPCNVLQGAVGDCWLGAAIAALAEFPDLVWQCFPTRAQQLGPGNSNGLKCAPSMSY